MSRNYDLPSGSLTVCDIENGPVEIVDLRKMMDLSSSLCEFTNDLVMTTFAPRRSYQGADHVTSFRPGIPPLQRNRSSPPQIRVKEGILSQNQYKYNIYIYIMGMQQLKNGWQNAQQQ